MFLKVSNKKYRIEELNLFKQRFKSLKFNLYALNHVLFFPKRKYFSTVFFCQRVDACFTDRDNKILYLYSNVKSEKRYVRFKAANLYIFPLDTCKYLKVGEKLKIVDK